MGEQEAGTPEQQNQLLFMQLVMMFQGAAFQHMGKVMNPVTQKIERDMAQAKHAIDMLGMLAAKTQGNLEEGEQRLLDHTLYELRMNYIDEVNKGEGGEEARTQEPQVPETEAESSGEEAPGEGSAEDLKSDGEQAQ